MISDRAFNLIVVEEVSSQAVYTKKYRRPEWPGASSGATVGIGYDLGQTARETIRKDWEGRVSASMLDAMMGASGYTGQAGKIATGSIKSLVDIPWETAIAVHRECVLPRWETTTRKHLPNCDKLSGDSFGALVSLTFNRGPSFSNAGERYREMRAIKDHMAAQRFGSIPAEFRSMKRLWPDLPGLQKRRDREAEMFRDGLALQPMPPNVPTPKPIPTQPAASGLFAALINLLKAIFKRN